MARTSEYKAEYPDILLDCMSKGMLDCEIFATLGVGKTTFYRYLKEYPDFKEAYELGLPRCEAVWARKGIDRFDEGNDKGFKYYVLVMNTKFGYRENQGPSGTTNNTQINIQGNMTVLQGKSNQELLESINSDISFLKEVGVIDAVFKALDDQSGLNEQEQS
jgi:hypothetical protein